MEAPDTNPTAEVVIDEVSWNNRRLRRRRKNVFQSRISVGLLSDACAPVAAEPGAEDADDA
jgi:16S rRNA C1402 (ribose-2'-O) methylase RsmI